MTGHNPTIYQQTTLNQGVRQRIACHHCQGGGQCTYIALLPPSRIQEDFWRAAISIVKDITPPNWRRLLTRRYWCLAPVVEEVAAQSCHRATVKNLRRLLMHRHCHCQGGYATKSKEIADAPTLQSCHRCWGDFLIAVLLLSRIWGKQKICGRNRQQPIQQTDFRHKQEGVTNKTLTERVRTEEVQMGRHDKQHFANTGEWNITTINNR